MAVGLFAVAAVALALGGLRFARGEAGGQEESRTRALDDGAPDHATPVEVDTIRRGSLVLEVTATGQVEPARRLALTSPIGGRIVDVAVGENESVEKGRILLRLDPRFAAAKVERAEAELAQARAQVRDLTLFDDGNLDAEKRRVRQEGAEVRAGVHRAEAAVREARLELAEMTITAPFAGVVHRLAAVPGQFVSAGQELVALVDLDPVHVDVRVIESELAALRAGGRARVRLSARPDTVFEGRIVSVGRIVDAQTRTAVVRVALPNSGEIVLPGMFAEVRLDAESHADRLLAPREAIVEREGRHLVFLFEAAGDRSGRGRARWTYVSLGGRNDRLVELIDGAGSEMPPPGSPVITAGGRTLIHGAAVINARSRGLR